MNYSFEKATYPMPYGFGTFKRKKRKPLTDEEISKIKASDKEKTQIAKEFNLSYQHVCRIKSGSVHGGIK